MRNRLQVGNLDESVNDRDVGTSEGKAEMNSPPTGSHRGTYDAVFRRPAAHNLQWRDVWSMLNTVADAVQEHNGTLKVTRNGQALVLHRPRGKDLADLKELAQVRHFLERSGAPAPPLAATATSPAATAGGAHVLVVIDHREARIYRTELSGSVPQRITPDDPRGDGRHLHYVEDDSNGPRKPERRSFYEAFAAALAGAGQVLVFGAGTGASSAMDRLLAELRRHHADLARRVVGSIVVDETHLTEDQLLAASREFYARMPAAEGGAGSVPRV
jgi:hypothetical protein